MTNLCKSNTPATYLDFDQLIEWLNKKGSELFGKTYKIDAKDYDTVYQILVYVYRDKEHAAKHGIDLGKGLIVAGPVGCGKTSLMQLLLHLDLAIKPYQMVSVRSISLQFADRGIPLIKEYGGLGQKQPSIFCFDELGGEPTTRFYGIKANVMREILLLRYELFMQKRVPTYVTTNLSPAEIESTYGTPLRSRLREMFNLVAFPEDSYDKRR
ncbi:hypothetical protein [Desertivirga arenae]|uniref:hypothetical protein n=1 Tax=Desertivirga arenae TaxID=2810309 RepID=UPI001A959591|nr:hypothetical protein [Pedobacter sp. SYSU D00823]